MHYVCHYFWFSTVASPQQGRGFDALLQQAFLYQVSMHWPCLPPAIPVFPTIKSINDSFIFKNSCFFNFGMSNIHIFRICPVITANEDVEELTTHIFFI